jgi:hypothetical protein
MGFTQNGQSSPAYGRRDRRVNVTEVETEAVELKEEGEDSLHVPEEVTPAELLDGEPTMRSVYQTLARRQRPPPKGGYPFKKNDHVATKMGRDPPSPCKVCGSTRHWDKECPDWNVYLEKQRRGVLSVSSSSASDEAELLYHSAYLVLMDDRITSNSF